MEKKTKDGNLKINPKGNDPKKYIELEPTYDSRSISEAKNNTAVITFGRFSPPTIGHEKLINKVKEEARKRRADPLVFASHSFDKKKNPLNYQQKISFLKIAFGPIIKSSDAKTIIEVAKELQNKYENLVLVVGKDRVSSFETLLNTYNEKEYNFKNIEVISAGDRDPDADDVSGMSASKLRQLAANKEFEEFKSGLPKNLKSNAKEVYDAVLKGMGLMEDIENNDGTLEEKVVPLTFAQRIKRSMVMKRYHGKIEAARKRAQMRRASPEKLMDRARKRALMLLRDRLSKSRSYDEMSAAEKLALDQRLSRIPQAVINRIATKQLPVVKKAELERIASLSSTKKEDYDLNNMFEEFAENFTQESSVNEDYYAGLGKSTIAKRKAHFNKGAAMDDNNPAAYTPAPGDARAKTKPSIYTKRFHKLFKKEGTVNHDRRFKIYKPKKNIFESVEDFTNELYDLVESVETLFENPEEGLRNKADQTGISYGILKKVYDRGVAAWRTGHRPGTTPSQWGFARVNSFATGGKTRHTTDADLWAKHKGKNESSEDLYVKEGQATDMVRNSIAREKAADAEKHRNMLDNARRVDAKRKSLRNESSDFINKIIEREKKHKEISKALKHFSEIVKNADKEDHLLHADNIIKAHDISLKPSELVKLYNRINNAKDYEKSYNAVDAWESVDKNDPRNREYGTDSLVKILKGDTPGENLKETRYVPPLKHAKTTVPDFVEPSTPDIAALVSKHNKHHLGIGLSLKQMVQHAIKSRDTDDDGDIDAQDMKAVGDGELVADPSFDQTKTPGEATSKMKKKYEKELKHTKVGVAFESADDAFETFLEAKARGFEGKLIDIPNTKIRTIDGKLKSVPGGKSSSSDGGSGDGE